MRAFGRSLNAARALSVVIASVAASTPYLALRFGGSSRCRALVASTLAFGTPWAIWLGASTVPESFTASLAAAGALGLAAAVRLPRSADDARRSKLALCLFAVAILAACLSRYEPWPVAAVVAMAMAWRAAVRGDVRLDSQATPAFRDSRRDATMRFAFGVAAILCILGPVAWMTWNAHVHDGPLHFFRRVSSFKRGIGEGSTNTQSALLLYPRLLLTTRPEVTIPALLLAPLSLRDPAVRARWGLPLLAAMAEVAFLAYGNARDGAPTHHPERALLGTLVILALFVGDVGAPTLQRLTWRGRRMGTAGVVGFAAFWLVSFLRGAEMPGRTPSEDRRKEMEQGLALRARGAREIIVSPCGFEHFALIAAYGSPENVETKPRDRQGAEAPCPSVQSR